MSLTAIEDGLLLKTLPNTPGMTYWVSPDDTYLLEGDTFEADDNNTGLSVDLALRTLTRAWALASTYDAIILLPGTHTLDASIVANVAGVTMMGFGPRTILTTSVDDETLNITAVGVEIAYINFVSAADHYSIINFTNADGLYIHDCIFDVSGV